MRYYDNTNSLSINWILFVGLFHNKNNNFAPVYQRHVHFLYFQTILKVPQEYRESKFRDDKKKK